MLVFFSLYTFLCHATVRLTEAGTGWVTANAAEQKYGTEGRSRLDL